MSGDPPLAEPIAYLVAERRGGEWLLGDDWTERCDTAAAALESAARGRASGYDCGVLVVTVLLEAPGERCQIVKEERR